MSPAPSAPAAAADAAPMSVEEALVHALRLHRAGHLEPAEKIYRAILGLCPDEAEALHLLGMLRHARGDSAEAIVLIRRALARVPDAPGAWNNLGNVLLESGSVEEAIAAYRRCLELVPDFAEAHNNLGTIHRSRSEWSLAEDAYQRALQLAQARAEAGEPAELLADVHNNLAGLMLARGRLRAAVDHACRAITVSPGQVGARKLLGLAYYTLGEFDKAAEVYRSWLADEPDNPIARHHLAACTGEAVPARAADDYVERTFDAFASSFDEKLQRLHYRAPMQVAQALEDACGAPAATLDILDAGCGTGLCGPLVRAHARRLEGVDLSAQMLQRAECRRVYDQLNKAELGAFLAARPAAWDVVLSADTLCYFGELGPVLAAAHGALRRGGRLFFTVEAVRDEDAGPPFVLQPNGRYAHTRDHVVAALVAAGFEAALPSAQVLRTEGGEPVAGWLVAACKP